MLQELEQELNLLANKEKAVVLQRFFKTGKGEYGEGDVFLGIIVPMQRKIAKKFTQLDTKEILELLNSKIHEKRLIALLVLIEQFKKADENKKKDIFDFYLDNSEKINNWDLVDLSAPNIVGTFLLDKKRDVLYALANSKSLWEKRISIVSTFAFIRNNDFKDTLSISKTLIQDRHDLIHKAVGWMLREVGKRDEECLIRFLNKNYQVMPRTMLRYSIERFDGEKRKAYLNGKA